MDSASQRVPPPSCREEGHSLAGACGTLPKWLWLAWESQCGRREAGGTCSLLPGSRRASSGQEPRGTTPGCTPCSPRLCDHGTLLILILFIVLAATDGIFYSVITTHPLSVMF